MYNIISNHTFPFNDTDIIKIVDAKTNETVLDWCSYKDAMPLINILKQAAIIEKKTN